MVARAVVIAAAATAVLSAAAPPQRAAASLQRVPDRLGPPDGLVATRHQPVPARLSDYWLVPDAAVVVKGFADPVHERIRRGVALLGGGDAAGAAALLADVPEATPLWPYAQFYSATALVTLGKLDVAEAVLMRLAGQPLVGGLGKSVFLKLADVTLARGTASEAERLLTGLADAIPNPSPDVWLKRGLVHEAAGHLDVAVEAFRRVYYRSPTSETATTARVALVRLGAYGADTPALLTAELARAELLYSARQWADARAAFAAVAPKVEGRDRRLATLRIAESDYNWKKYRAARDGLRDLIDDAAYGAEARYTDAMAAKGLRDAAGFVRLARDVITRYPESEWAAESLNSLATYYVQTDKDAEAEEVLRELLSRFPRHRHAERAAWKIGWLSYRQRQYADVVQIFERAAATFPRADNRPGWVYWAGRARDALGDEGEATARYRVVLSDYQNSYYGRLASNVLRARGDAPLPRAVPVNVSAAAVRPANEAAIGQLIAAGLFEDALQEVQYAQQAWGDSPRLQATAAWIRHRQGISLTATERFAALRGAITTMRRAYPQFMASGGEALPQEILRIIFPLDYWPLITKYAAEHDLDPFLVAALMAQESTFTAEIRSAANAYGLMQIIPSTGRSLARAVGVKNFTTAMLKQPETNVRLGTQYFKDLLSRFGGAHLALAGYNAGPHRVVRWLAAAPDAPADEFVDSIPFTETQGYVKRILGTADDYRRLYDGGGLDPFAGLGAATGVVVAPASVPAAPSTKTPAAPRRAPARPRRATAKR